MLLNTISSKEIEQLTDVQFAKLLHLLITLDNGKHEVIADVTVPDKITVGDGGLDGTIETKDTKASTWLSEKKIGFQVKATRLSAGDCYKEITVKNADGSISLKPMVQQLLDDNGTYILFMMYQPGSEQKISERIEQFFQATADAGKNYKKEQFKIYDSKKIADWTNDFITAVVFVQEAIGITRPKGLLTMGKWANYSEIIDTPFFKNSTIEKNIATIKAQLEAEKACIRVIGHSGLGKTRLVYEALNEIPNASKLCLYYYVESKADDIIAFVKSNIDVLSGILVVDNCPYPIHNRLKREVQRLDSKLKLITIDYSVEEKDDNNIGDTYIYVENTDYRDVVEQMLDYTFRDKLTPQQIKEIAEYSEGYPVIAKFFADARLDGIENLSEMLQTSIQERLVFGRDYENKDLQQTKYKILKSISIFKEFRYPFPDVEKLFGKEEYDKSKSQAEFICADVCIPPVSTNDLHEACEYFKRKGILERRGRFYAVRPNPLAIKLTLDWFRSLFDKAHVLSLFEKLIINDLSVSFTERFKYLNDVRDAQAFVNEIVGQQGPFYQAGVLNTSTGSRLFRSFVEVSPVATNQALIAAFGSMPIDVIKHDIGPGRRNLVWSLEKLVFDDKTFDDAAKLLLRFAAAENEDIGNNATYQFAHLFHIQLPGTEVNLDRRLKILKWAIEQKEHEYLSVILAAIAAGLKFRGFSRMLSAEKQGTKLLTDYQPKTWAEVTDYWDALLRLSLDIFVTKKESDVKDIIAKSLPLLFLHNMAPLAEHLVTEVLKQDNSAWKLAIDNLTLIKRRKQNKPEDELIINKLLSLLSPSTIHDQIKILVTNPINQFEEVNGTIKDHSLDAAIDFATTFKEDAQPIIDNIIDFLSGEQRYTFYFARKIAEYVAPENILPHAFLALKNLPREEQNSAFISGYISALPSDKQLDFLKQIINDDDLFEHSFNVAINISSLSEAINELFSLVDQKKAPVERFGIFISGGTLRSITDEQLVEYCNKLAERSLSGQWVAISTIVQNCYKDEEKWSNLKSTARKIVSMRNMLLGINGVGTMEMFYWFTAVSKLIQGSNDVDLAKILSEHIFEFTQNTIVYSNEDQISQVCEILYVEYFSIFWPIFSPSLTSSGYFSAKSLVGASNGYNSQEGFIFNSHVDELIKWATENIPIAPKRLAYMMPIAAHTDDKVTWHPFTRRMVETFYSVPGFFAELDANMGSFGSIGSSIPYYREMEILVREFVNSPVDEIRKWANSRLEMYKDIIAKEKLNDEEDFITRY